MRLFDFLRAALILAVLAAAAQMLLREERLDGAAEAVDGDTLHIAGTRVRLAGIDAPELAQTCMLEGRAWGCGAAARRVLEEALSAGVVACVALGRDKYGRPLARCAVGSLDLADHLVRKGFAIAYLRSDHAAAEAEAKAARRGIWAGSFEAPADFRAEHPRAR